MLLFAILSVTLAAFTFDDGQCTCNQLVVETECKFNTQCTWDGVAKTCSRKSCADLKDQCSSTQGCALDSNGICKDFTKCADYKVSGLGQCQSKDKTCTEDQATSSGYACKTGTYVPECQKITIKADCKGYQSSTQVCFWTTNPMTKASECMPVKYTSCEDGQSDPNLCTLNSSCKYTVEKKCVPKTCADVTTEFYCTSIPQWNNSKLTLCQWNGNCQDASGVEVLTQAKCYSSTLKNYHWVTSTNKCTLCAASTTTPTGTSTGTSTGTTTGTSTGTTTGTSTGTTTGTSTGTTTTTGTGTGSTTGTTTTTGTSTGTGTGTSTTTTTGTNTGTKPNDAYTQNKFAQLIVVSLFMAFIQ